MDIKMELPNKVEIIQPVVDFTYRWALNSGLEKPEAVELATAVDELITDVVLFAFEEEATFNMFFKSSLSDIEIILQELGEPFDPERHKYSVEKVKKENNFEGAGFKLIKSLVDHFVYIYKGRAGKEFRIVKNIKHKHITQLFAREILHKEPEKAVSYQIAPVTENDAEDIARLIYRSYGYTYPKEDMYYPDRIVKALREGKKFGVIVRTDKGEAVGYFAVIRSTDSNIGEVGEVVVSPKHRGKGIMKMMMKALIDMAKSKGLLGLFGEAVTVHTISQKVNAKYGFKSTALVLGFFPYAEYKGFKQTKQRISVVIDFLPLVEREKVQLYLPVEYSKILKQIYQNLGIEVKNLPLKHKINFPEKSRLRLNINYKLQNAVIIVDEYGQDFLFRIREKEKALIEKGVKGLYIDLPLHKPYTKKVAKLLRENGYIFAGLMPLFHKEQDFLRMQKITEPIDFRYINIYSPMAKKIKRKVYSEYKKVI